jgi:outer membrane protein
MTGRIYEDIVSLYSALTYLILILFVWYFPGGLPDAQGAERQLTFQEAVKLALADNNEIRALRHSVAAGKEDIGMARSQLLPRISFEERFTRTTNPTYAFMAKLNQGRFTSQDFDIHSLNHPDAVNDYQTAISIEQPVFVKKAYVGLDISRTEHAAQNENFKRKKEEIIFKVAYTYLMVHTAREHLAVAEKAIEDTQEHLRIARLRYKDNLGLYSDTLRAGTALTEATQKQISAKKNLELAKRTLGLCLGIDESIETVESIPALSPRDIDYYTKASLNRKDVKSMELKSENARNGIKLAEADYLPSVGLAGSYQLNDHRYPLGSEGDSWQVIAFLRWNLFEGMKTQYEKTKAKYQAAEVEERLKGLKNSVSYRVFEAYLAVEETKKNTELSRQALESAEEGKRLVKVRYENAFSPMVDLLDAQLVNDRARANLVAKENEYNLAVINLSFESGTILADLKIESE